MDESAANTHWRDGRIRDAVPTTPGPWSFVLGVMVLLVCVDLSLSLAPEAPERSPHEAATSAGMRRTLAQAVAAAREGRPAIVLVGDSVLAGDVMEGRVEDWQHKRVIDYMRAGLSPDNEARVEQIALDGLLPVDALHVLAELDRMDPQGRVQFVLELNFRYFSREYREQWDCSRNELCALGRMAASPDAGTVARGLAGLAEASGHARDWLSARAPVHRHRERLRELSLVELDGLAVARPSDQRANGGGPGSGLDAAAEQSSQRRTEGLARVKEHYRSSRIEDEDAQTEALEAIVARLHARRRPALLFFTPLEDEFRSGALPGNRLGRRQEAIARLVHDRTARVGEPQSSLVLVDLDHPIFVSGRFLDHVHLDPEGNRLLALNLLHELALPMAERPPEWAMVHDEDHDRTLIHRRGTGYADGSSWNALLHYPNGIAVSRDGAWVVVADTRNHALRQLRGNMLFLERLAGEPTEAGHKNGPALDGARLERPRSPEIVGEAVYFLDGKGRSRVRELREGVVSEVAWTGPRCSRYDHLEAREIEGRPWLYLLCRNDSILSVDLRRRVASLALDRREQGDPVRGGWTRKVETLEPIADDRLVFADGESRIWSVPLDEEGAGGVPELWFANEAEHDLPQALGWDYPFGFSEMKLEKIVGMEWVERYGALLIQDEHAIHIDHNRLQRETTERIQLRLLDFEHELIYPWMKAIPHGGAYHMWNAKTQSMVGYYHLGSMAIAQDDASLVWAELKRSRIFRLADGLLGASKYGNHHTVWVMTPFINPLSTHSAVTIGSTMRPDRYLSTRHEPAAHRGPYVALVVGSSLSALSDRIENYSLARHLERELQAELGYRDRIRLDMYQRSWPAASLTTNVDSLEDFLTSSGPAPDVVFVEAHSFGGDSGSTEYFRHSKTAKGRMAQLARLERLASRYDTLVVFYDNSAMSADGSEGLRATSGEVKEFLAEARKLGFVVLEPSDRMLRELLVHSPWSNQPWGKGQHHGAPWSIELTARALATMAYPTLRDFLRDREPARLREHGVRRAGEGG